ncbi:hypothetical protein RIF29_30030 [Crotalaria pallida]|uniref:DUF4216 domain-containing protein n=1 Tax=Crotalaria pallida TaxID=3830 RepID=A0AAN9EHX6_CROPI
MRSDFIREHGDTVSNHTKRRRWTKAKAQSQDFGEWFKTRALKDDVSPKLKQFSRGPNTVAKRFSAYTINGYRFHTRKRDARRKTQNFGVTLVSLTASFASSKDENPRTEPVTYYGVINDMIGLDYYGHFKFVLFKCDWFEVEEDKYGLTCVNFNKKMFQNDPFVLASQVHQCFYVQDPFEANKHYVMKTVPRDLFNMSDDVSELEAQASYQSEPFDDRRNPNAPPNNEVNLVREDLPRTVVDAPPQVLHEAEPAEDSDIDDTLFDFID